MFNIVILLPLIKLSYSKQSNQVYFISGYNGSPLYGTILDGEKYKMCAGLKHQQFFPPDEQFYTKYPICQSLFMTTSLNQTTGKVTSLPGILVETLPFGEYDFGWDLELAKHVDCIGISYNFMYHFQGSNEQYINLNNSISGMSQKVILIGYSQGTHFVLDFLLRFISDKRWIDSHIEGIVLIAPAFGGKGYFPKQISETYPPFVDNDEMKTAVRRMPGLHMLMPNYKIFGDDTMIYNYKGEKNLTARDIGQFLFDEERFDTESYEIFKLTEKYDLQNDYLTTTLRNDDGKNITVDEYFENVRKLIVYNSGMETNATYKWNTTTNDIKDMQVLTRPGDQSVPAEGPKYICEKWCQNEKLKCHDYVSNTTNSHVTIVNSKETVEMLLEFIVVKNDYNLKVITYVGVAIGVVQVVVAVIVVIVIRKKEGREEGTGAYQSFE